MIKNLEINPSHQQVIHISRWFKGLLKGNINFEIVGIEDAKLCNPYITESPCNVVRELEISGSSYLLNDYVTDVLHFDVSPIERTYINTVKVFLPKDITYCLRIYDPYTSVTVKNLNISGTVTNCKKFVLSNVTNKKSIGTDIYGAEEIEICDSNIDNVYFVGENALISNSNLGRFVTVNDSFTACDSNIKFYNSELFSILNAENTTLEKITFHQIDGRFDSCKLNSLEGYTGNFVITNCDFNEGAHITLLSRGSAYYKGSCMKKGNNKVLIYQGDPKNIIGKVKTKKVDNSWLFGTER